MRRVKFLITQQTFSQPFYIRRERERDSRCYEWKKGSLISQFVTYQHLKHFHKFLSATSALHGRATSSNVGYRCEKVYFCPSSFWLNQNFCLSHQRGETVEYVVYYIHLETAAIPKRLFYERPGDFDGGGKKTQTIRKG